MRRSRTSKARTSERAGAPPIPSRDFPSPRIITGTVWHQGSPAREVLAVADPAVTFGRYHRIHGSGVWYSSTSEAASWAELFRHHDPSAVSPFEVRRRMGRVRVRGLRVLDLTQARTREAFGLSADDLISDDLSRCQFVAERARRAGYDGILAPSAALEGHRTLAVFASAVRKMVVESSSIRNPPARMRALSGKLRLQKRPSGAQKE